VQDARAPAGLQWSSAYFLAIAIWVAAVYRRFTSVRSQLLNQSPEFRDC